MYKFPVIKTLDDVLPAIANHDEINVMEREHYDVVNYNVAFRETFDPSYEGFEMRRECRGLIFDKSGKLISRPFHKFFNVNEHADVHQDVLKVSQPHVIMEKEDGSMIRAFFSNGKLRLGTKMGVTDIAEQAEAWLDSQPDADARWAYLRDLCDYGFTPLMEFVGPDNRIVLDYDEADLIMLAVRENEEGVYWPNLDNVKHFTKVKTHGSIDGDMKEFIARQKALRDREGDIVFWPATGQMVKYKNDWYVQIHKILDEVRSFRHVARKLYDAELDDVRPKLDEPDLKVIDTFCDDLHQAETAMVEHIESVCTTVHETYGNDRKRIALEYINELDTHDKWLSKFIFSFLDGHSVAEMVRTKIYDGAGSMTRFNDVLEWLELEEYKQ